ncbi:tetraacyldisaccharide 4'-kinase [Rhodococcus sp. SRB_17]|nr:tetraacyldisaccharide 4'-kinase [Rhodococcus sp. SRB_17]
MAAAPQPASAPRSTPPLEAALLRAWRRRGALAWALWPLSLLYGLLVALRRALYRTGLRRAEHPGVPVLVVGNVIAGGAGKTPVVMAVVRHLQAQGWQPGVVSRGYGRSAHDCRLVRADSLPSEVGDEPALIARRCGVPVAVAPRRIDAARALLAQHPGTDVLVCDDGLQHWALAHDVAICVFNDGGVGNGFLLPAGPLREPWPRAVDLVVHAGPAPDTSAPTFALRRQLADHALRADGQRVPLPSLRGEPLRAVAAIARPEDFFAMLRAQGLTLADTLALPDHFDFDSWKRPSGDLLRLICTEKDAAKLWRQNPDALAVPLQVDIDGGFFAALDALLRRTLSSPS